MIEGVKRAAKFVKSHNRPMTTAELRRYREEIENKGENRLFYYISLVISMEKTLLGYTMI